MRTTLITSVLAASALTVGFAATAGAAESGDGGQVATPTTAPFGLEGLGLSPEQMTCLINSATSIDFSDMSAIMELMSQCGIDPMDLLAGQTTPTVPGTPTSVLGVVPSLPAGEDDPAAAAAVLAMLGVDAAAAQCIEDGLLAAVSPGDDNEALAILQSCGLSLNDVLTGLVAVNAAAGSSTETTIAGAPTTAVIGPLVQQLIDTVQQQYGIDLSPDQASCLLNNIASVDPNDMSAMLGLMEECGISLSDLAGG